MNEKDAIIMILVYIFLMFWILLIEINDIKKKKEIVFHNYISFFFLLFYCITPIINLFYQYVSIDKEVITQASYLTNDTKFYYLTLIVTIITYLAFRLGYKVKVSVKSNIKNRKEIDINSKNFTVSAIVLCLIGWIALILWTKVYGMPWDIFPYASEIRSGYVRIHNSYTFVKPFCPILIISTYCFFIILLETKKKYKIIYFIFMLFSIFGSIIYMIANDGRLMIILFFLVPIIYCILRKKQQISFLKIIIVSIVTLMLLGSLDNITYFFRNSAEREKEATNSVIKVISEELTFVHMNVVNSLYMRENNIITEYTAIQDLINILYSWVPERIKPDSIVTLYELNTSKYPNTRGTLPTDLITAGIYKYGSIAFMILPIFLGMLTKLIETFFNREENKFTKIIIILLSVYLGLKINGYYDLSCILFGVFYIAISYAIILIINNIKLEAK